MWRYSEGGSASKDCTIRNSSSQTLMCIKWGWRYIWVRLWIFLFIAIIFIKGMDIDSYWFTPAPKSGPFISLYVFQHSYWSCGDCLYTWNCFRFCRKYDQLFFWADWGSSSDLNSEGVRFEPLLGHRLFQGYQSFLLTSLIICWDITADRSWRFPFSSSFIQPRTTVVKGPLWFSPASVRSGNRQEGSLVANRDKFRLHPSLPRSYDQRNKSQGSGWGL